MFIFIYILHSKYLLAKSKYQIYHIFFWMVGIFMSRGVFRMGGLLSSGHFFGGICPDIRYHMCAFGPPNSESLHP